MPELEKNYSKQPMMVKQVESIWSAIDDGFEYEKRDQDRSIDNYWDVYNCVLNDNQRYYGTSCNYVPAVHDAIDARIKRFKAMLFPGVGNQVEVISESGDRPTATMALQEHYVRSSRLREFVPAILRNGDVEGQWSIEISWEKKSYTALRQDVEDEDGLEVNTLKEEEIVEQGPEVSIIAAQDLLVVPATAATIDDADLVCRIIRLTQTGVDKYVKDEIFDEDAAKKINKETKQTPAMKRSESMGIKLEGRRAHYFKVFKIWCTLKFPREEEPQPAIVYASSMNNILGIYMNPFWTGKVPVISCPLERIAGSFWGRSKIAHVEPMQYQLNDLINMSTDSAGFSVMPIVMTDPVKQPLTASMILGMGAIWQTNPQDTQFAAFPQLWKSGYESAAALKSQIWESMDVNESMLGLGYSSKKNAQAVGAEQSQIQINVADVVRNFENGVMTPCLHWFYEMDQQYREDDILIMQTGELGMQAKIERIPPMQVYQRYWFQWNGSEQQIGLQKIQQQIAFMNVLRGIPPQQLNGRRLDVGPILDLITDLTFGHVLSGKILIDQTKEITMPADQEDEIMANGLALPVHPLDNDAWHLQTHQQSAAATGDPHGTIRAHILAHVRQMQEKAAQAGLQPTGQPGVPGGAGPGVPGTPAIGGPPGMPRQGAMPGNLRLIQGPPGQIHADQIADPMAQPRG